MSDANHQRSKRLYLRKNEDRRVRAGHLWIYANEIDTRRTPLSAFAPGERAELHASNGGRLGSAYVNGHSLIAARVLTRDDHGFDYGVLKARLAAALALRERLFRLPYYRWVFAESDFLPGLVVDRYDDVIVCQFNTAGISLLGDDICTAIDELVAPTCILLKNDSESRKLEGLDGEVVAAKGNAPPTLAILENGTEYASPWPQTQKTGWFYDQRDNRQRLNTLLNTAAYADARVLDVFSYLGAYAIQALKYGAARATLIDASASATAQARGNAAANGVDDRIEIICGDAIDSLRRLANDERRFDIVIVDPPAFIARKKAFRDGLAAYQRLNELAIGICAEDGLLVSSSCSYHASRDDYLNVIRKAGLRRKRDLQVLIQGHQALDHPVHPAMPETNYLKTFFVHIV